MNPRRYDLLTALLKQPTAPFREDHVIDFVARTLERARVPYFPDPVGNLIVGCDSRAAYRRLIERPGREPVRVFIAHLDHPGFHGVRWLSATRLRIAWHGGSPVKHLAGSRMWLATRVGRIGDGTLTNVSLHKSGLAFHSAELRLPRAVSRPAATEIFGGFKFRAPVWRSGGRLYTHAADDLVGVFAILNTALDLFRRRTATRPPFIGLLTRAEEVGFVGAIGHLELGWLDRARKPIIVISLETSRTLPNALIGKGPVVRLGDRRTVFDPNALKLLTDIAQRALPKKHQRRIMDGGTCEATAATVYDFPAIGLSVPLGNYHNQAFEGGPDARGHNGPAPEFVHLNDIDGLLTLCAALLKPKLPWSHPWQRERRAFKKRLHHYRNLLVRPK